MTIPSPAITVTGTIVDAQGNPLTSGSVTFTLAGYGQDIPKVSGFVLIDQLSVSAAISNGVFSCQLYGNDVITPLNQTFYTVTVPSGSGSYVKNYQLTGSGSFDISSLVPIGSSIPSNVSPTGVTPNVQTAATGQFFNGLASNGTFSTALPTQAATFAVSGNETVGGTLGVTGLTTMTGGAAIASASTVKWSTDVALSRIAASTIGIGNGTPGDVSGILNANLIGTGTGGTVTFRTAATGIAGLSGPASATVAVGNGGAGDFSGTLQLTTIQNLTANGGQWVRGQASEQLTLSTGGTTTDTSANLLPANSIIEAVIARVTTTITVATDWKLGDSAQAARFTAAQSGGQLTAGATVVGLNHADPTVASSNLGPVQTSAAKVRVTTTGTPGAGVIRITVFYRQFVAPTS